MSRRLEEWRLFDGPLGVVEAKERTDGKWELIDRGTRVHVLYAPDFELQYKPYDPFETVNVGTRSGRVAASY
jgi:hypothetical protein